MVALLRKAIASMVNRLPGSTFLEEKYVAVGDDECSRLSGDLLLSIFEHVRARDLVMASAVCKRWRALANEEMLWEALLQNLVGPTNWEPTLFAESFLSTGVATREPHPSFSYRQVYADRAQPRQCVIIDGGSGYCKYGWSHQDAPENRLQTFLEFGNMESPVYQRLKDLFATLFQCMQAKPSAQPIVLAAPISHSDNTDTARAARKQLREVTHAVLFDLGVPKICYVNQAVLALFSANRTSGIVVNIGFNVTSVVPILHGKVMRSVGVEIVGQGAMQLTVRLSELMQQNLRPATSMYTVRTLKEKLCFVSEDYEKDLTRSDGSVTFNVHNEGAYTLGDERFRAPEILFQPRLGRLRTMSLQQAVALCMEHAANLTVAHKADEGWFKTIVLCGGTACLPGLAGRLKRELCKCLSSSSLTKGLEVLPPKHGPDSAWYGGKLLSNIGRFSDSWCVSRKKYKKMGHAAVHAMAVEDESFQDDRSMAY